jgi:predicted aminopeptidase
MDNVPAKFSRKIAAARLALCTLCAALCAVSSGGCYLIQQGRYVLKYSTGARSMEKMRRLRDTPEELRAFFLLIKEVRSFAVDSIGLADNNNFSKYINIRRNHVVDVVYGAGKLNFTPYTWSFPFFGTFPNKGFFERGDAQKEADRLSAKGYEACVLPAGAFSTLGFFSDPVYSYMQRYSPFRLAYLIFHEQTHATLFIKSRMQFNEELATFVGREAGLRFVRMRYGDTSEQYKSALNSMHDEDAYYDLMRSLYARLKPVYDSAGMKDDEKLRLKEEIIGRFKDSIAANYDSLFRSQDYRGLSKTAINNATLVADMTYTLNVSIFHDLYERKNRDFKAMLASLKTLKKKKGDLHELVKGL